jgi:hypothetical protein
MRSGRSDIQTIPAMASGFAASIINYFKFPGVTADSRVVASISEVDSNGKPFIGDATLWVNSVAPNDNGEIWVEVKIQWETSINFRITCFVDP